MQQHGRDAQCHEEGDDGQRDLVAQRPALSKLQEHACELLHAYQREAYRKWHGMVGQPDRVRPQVFESKPVQREQHQSESSDMEQIPEVAGIAQGQPHHQVVDEKCQQDAVVQADGELRIARLFDERHR